jgi:hypothetical protein
LGNVNTFHAVEGPVAAIPLTQMRVGTTNTSTSRRTDRVGIEPPWNRAYCGGNRASQGQKRGGLNRIFASLMRSGVDTQVFFYFRAEWEAQEPGKQQRTTSLVRLRVPKCKRQKLRAISEPFLRYFMSPRFPNRHPRLVGEGCLFSLPGRSGSLRSSPILRLLFATPKPAYRELRRQL